MRRTLAALIALTAALSACDGGGSEDGREPPPQSPTMGEQGVAGDCENGWSEPEPGTARYEKALRLIARFMRVEGELDVDEMRYFEGPESPPSEQGYLRVVKRWYVKGSLADDPSFRGRWLVEERFFGSGVVAVAPYDTSGFTSPDWRGFQHREADPERRAYPGLPGEYAGDPYDFVTGGDVFDFPGLPQEVTGCLRGT